MVSMIEVYIMVGDGRDYPQAETPVPFWGGC